MTARKLDEGYVENLWSMFKTVDEKHVVSADDYKRLSSSGISIPQESAQLALRIYSKAAKSCATVQEFSKVLENNEFPPIKLTKKEMEFVKGGLAKVAATSTSTRSRPGPKADSAESSGSCHGESTGNYSAASTGSCHGESN